MKTEEFTTRDFCAPFFHFSSDYCKNSPECYWEELIFLFLLVQIWNCCIQTISFFMEGTNIFRESKSKGVIVKRRNKKSIQRGMSMYNRKRNTRRSDIYFFPPFFSFRGDDRRVSLLYLDSHISPGISLMFSREPNRKTLGTLADFLCQVWGCSLLMFICSARLAQHPRQGGGRQERVTRWSSLRVKTSNSG